jgi:hypothetical protein
MNREYVKVTELDKEYIVSDWGNTVIVKYQAPQFEIAGIPDPKKNGGKFYRMDYALATTEGGNYYRFHMNNIIQRDNWFVTGGTIRFCTNAEYFNLIAATPKFTDASKRSNGRGVSGFDVYVGSGTQRVYCGKRKQVMCNPPSTVDTVALPAGYKEVLINMPLASGIANLTFAFPKGAEIAPPTKRSFDKPIVFYGSAITQGLCASRPGTSYANMVCRMLDAECRNFGYSEGDRAEDETIAYLASLDMSAFVMEYDNEVPFGQLEKTHHKLYEAIRAAHPEIPIVMISKPIFTVGYDTEPLHEDEQRIALVKDSYEKATAAGDNNVYFINGYEDILPMRAIADVYTGDFSRPNDAGMYFIAMALYNKLAGALVK